MPDPRASALRIARIAGAPLAVGIVSLLAGWQGPRAELLRFDRSAILAGELWRLLTGHLVHGSFMHWLLNVAGLLLIALLFNSEDIRRQLATLAGIALIVSLALLLFNQTLMYYVGLSGVLHGLFVWHALRELRGGSGIAGIALILLIAKLAWEQIAGPSAGTESLVGLPVIVDAHLYGAVGGALLGLFRHNTPKATQPPL